MIDIKEKLQDYGQLVFASHNAGKIEEVTHLLSGKGLKVSSALALNLAEPEETEETFKGNALLKAKAACQATGLPALADDSGLAVEALEGAPGVYSARWAETEGQDGRDFEKAMGKVNQLLTHSSNRKGAFLTVLALVFPTGEEVFFEGVVQGEITWPPRGDKGFGYDPIFQPEGKKVSFAQMELDEKQQLSHRGRALRTFIEACFE